MPAARSDDAQRPISTGVAGVHVVPPDLRNLPRESAGFRPTWERFIPHDATDAHNRVQHKEIERLVRSVPIGTFCPGVTRRPLARERYSMAGIEPSESDPR